MAPDEASLVLGRAERTYVILNLYPYTTGHLMIVPYAHVAALNELDDATSFEMMASARHACAVLDEVYHPHGLNIGLNLGKAAGAGIQEHLHMHVVPRWHGDANFMSVVGETRVIPEDLSTTFAKLRPHFVGS
jgi:ATP adenylyltransferase